MSQVRHPFAVAAATLALAAAAPAAAQSVASDSAFRWSGRVDPGARVVVRTLYGEVRVESGDGDSVAVRAVTAGEADDRAAVHVRVTRVGPGGRDVLVCGVWRGATLACGESSYVVNNDGGNRARVDFVVTVPRRSDVAAESINGRVHVAGVDGVIRASTVNGRVAVAVRPDEGANLVVSTLNGSFRSDLPLDARGLGRRGTTRATLGAGGRTISLSSVNGEMRLLRAPAGR